MPYELISDGKPVPLGDSDICSARRIWPAWKCCRNLIRAGVASLKIEGRLKIPEYVANITRVYRQALRMRLRQCRTAQSIESGADPLQSRYEMEMGFSRGLYTGWFRGINNQELVHARFGKKRGVYLGEVTRSSCASASR